MSVRLATAIGLVRGLLSLSKSSRETEKSEANKKRGAKAPLFFCLLIAKAPFVRVR
jgi:hypothetical protein